MLWPAPGNQYKASQSQAACVTLKPALKTSALLEQKSDNRFGQGRTLSHYRPFELLRFHARSFGAVHPGSQNTNT